MEDTTPGQRMTVVKYFLFSLLYSSTSILHLTAHLLANERFHTDSLSAKHCAEPLFLKPYYYSSPTAIEAASRPRASTYRLAPLTGLTPLHLSSPLRRGSTQPMMLEEPAQYHRPYQYQHSYAQHLAT
jgi:hypothetical protein